jgi:fluoride exporter
MVDLYAIFAVAIGGAIGSVARFLIGVGATNLLGVAFPWGTVAINVFGSFLIALLAEGFALRWDVSQTWRIFLTVGLCGGFTTFSTFSLDAYVLMQRGEMAMAGAYVVGSVVLSIAALFTGLHLVRSW